MRRVSMPSWLAGKSPTGLTAVFFTSIFVSTQLTGTSCSCNSDQFVCGSPIDKDEAHAAICDQSGESCICATNRCAVHDPKCPSTLRYSLGDTDCVELSHAPSALYQLDGGASFCKGAGPTKPCGIIGGDTCPANQECACATHRCVYFDSVCASGYREVESDLCAAPTFARPEGLLSADGGQALCVDQESLPPSCGVVIPGRSVVQCDAGEICVCAENHFRCALKSPSCATSGYAWSSDVKCIESLSAKDIEGPADHLTADGVCPQYADLDAGGTSTGTSTGTGATTETSTGTSTSTGATTATATSTAATGGGAGAGGAGGGTP